jgi:endonuclease/exonuclease/phosphatase (EEP) superfamily protein YafD
MQIHPIVFAGDINDGGWGEGIPTIAAYLSMASWADQVLVPVSVSWKQFFFLG